MFFRNVVHLLVYLCQLRTHIGCASITYNLHCKIGRIYLVRYYYFDRRCSCEVRNKTAITILRQLCISIKDSHRVICSYSCGIYRRKRGNLLIALVCDNSFISTIVISVSVCLAIIRSFGGQYSATFIIGVRIINGTCFYLVYILSKNTNITRCLSRIEEIDIAKFCRKFRNSPTSLCNLYSISANSFISFFSNKSNIRSVRVSTHAFLYACHITLGRNHTRQI